MGKTDALLKEMGGNLAESIGVRTGPVRAFPVPPRPGIPTASPKDGFSRDRSAGEMLLTNIVPDPDQPRKDFDQGAIERLSESIKAGDCSSHFEYVGTPSLPSTSSSSANADTARPCSPGSPRCRASSSRVS